MWCCPGLHTGLTISLTSRGGDEDIRLEVKGTKKIRGQGQTLSRPRTGMLKAKAKDTGASVPQKKKKFSIFFSGDLQKRKTKKGHRKFFGIFLNNFKHKQIPTIVGTDANVHRTIWGSSSSSFFIARFSVRVAGAVAQD